MKLSPTDFNLGACLTAAFAIIGYIFFTHMRPGSISLNLTDKRSCVFANCESSTNFHVTLNIASSKNSLQFYSIFLRAIHLETPARNPISGRF